MALNLSSAKGARASLTCNLQGRTNCLSKGQKSGGGGAGTNAARRHCLAAPSDPPKSAPSLPTPLYQVLSYQALSYQVLEKRFSAIPPQTSVSCDGRL